MNVLFSDVFHKAVLELKTSLDGVNHWGITFYTTNGNITLWFTEDVEVSVDPLLEDMVDFNFSIKEKKKKKSTVEKRK